MKLQINNSTSFEYIVILLGLFNSVPKSIVCGTSYDMLEKPWGRS
jgi:hypothetical protein